MLQHFKNKLFRLNLVQETGLELNMRRIHISRMPGCNITISEGGTKYTNIVRKLQEKTSTDLLASRKTFL